MSKVKVSARVEVLDVDSKATAEPTYLGMESVEPRGLLWQEREVVLIWKGTRLTVRAGDMLDALRSATPGPK